MTLAVRNYARALDRVRGRESEALKFYLQAVCDCADVDDTSARWLAAELWSQKRFRDAIEIAIIACMTDLDDGELFANLSVEVSELLQPNNIFSRGEAQVNAFELDVEFLKKTIFYGRSCAMLSVEARERFESAMKNADITSEDIQQLVDEYGPPSRKDRANFMLEAYSKFKSDLTTKVRM